MNCKECLSIIEEYVEGELSERTAGFVTAHIAGCAACAKVYDDLQREHKMYAGFLSDVRESPALWSAVRASIDKEAAVPATQPLLTRSWFSGLSNVPRFSVAFALVLLIIGIGVMRYFRSPGTKPDRLSNAAKPGPAAPSPQNPIRFDNRVTAGTRVEASDKTGSPGTKANRRRDGLSKELLMVNSNRRQNDNMKPVLASQISPGPSKPEELALNPEVNDVEQRRLKFSSFLDGKTARHLERSEVMLRSFRNVIRADEGSTYDISYERRWSRELLTQNILLRRNAAARGDVLTENLLSRLEPVLLDIANLQDRTPSADLRLIDQRIRDKEIIATLQAYIG